MGARKSRRSRSVAVDRARFGLARPTPTRSPLPVVVVVCDDARTALAYFLELKRAVKSAVTLLVERNPSDGCTPAEVVAAAAARRKSLRREGASDRGDKTSVWALIDLEADEQRRTQAHKAKADGQRQGISVALSDPCYELWTLLHLEDTGTAFADCRAVLARIEQQWKAKFAAQFGKKAQADYSRIVGGRMIAAARARRHHKNGDQSWTEVYLLVEEIERYCGDAAREAPHS